MNFLKLISIENFKLWKRLSSKIMLVIMVVLVLFASGLMKYYYTKNNIKTETSASATWKQDTRQRLPAEKTALAKAEKSTSKSMRADIGSMKKTVSEDEYSVAHNIPPVPSIWSKTAGMDSNAGYGQFLALMMIIACAAAVAGEFSEGTMKAMITRPYSRAQILSAKLAATLLYGLVLLVVTQIASFLTLGILFGFNNMGATELFWTGSKIVEMPAFAKALAIFGLDFLTMTFYTLLAFALSAIFRSRSIATGFGIFACIVGASLVEIIAVYFDWGRYLPFASADFVSLVTQGTKLAGVTLGFSLISTAIYAAVMTFAGYFVFQKRDI